MFNPEILTGSS